MLVDTKYQTFDYPGPNGDVYSPYTGSGGIPIGSFLNRLAFAIRFGDIRFFTTSAITGRSRVIILNNIRARLAAAAPFLTFDATRTWSSPAAGSTGSPTPTPPPSRIPYSEPNGGINYIRNSVKVVIDAYNGSMRFYVFDPQDPLIRTYEKIFPGVF